MEKSLKIEILITGEFLARDNDLGTTKVFTVKTELNCINRMRRGK